MVLSATGTEPNFGGADVAAMIAARGGGGRPGGAGSGGAAGGGGPGGGAKPAIAVVAPARARLARGWPCG